MLLFDYLFISGLFIITASQHDPMISIKSNDIDKTINLALETVFEFNKKDKVADLKLLDRVKDLISNIKYVLIKHDSLRRDFNDGNIETFTDFMISIIEILNKFEDTDLKNFFTIVSNEIKNYRDRTGSLNDAPGDDTFQSYLVKELDALENESAGVIKDKMSSLSNLLEEETYKNVIDSMYKRDSKSIFKNIISDLNNYRLKTKKNIDIVKIVKNGVKYVIFENDIVNTSDDEKTAKYNTTSNSILRNEKKTDINTNTYNNSDFQKHDWKLQENTIDKLTTTEMDSIQSKVMNQEEHSLIERTKVKKYTFTTLNPRLDSNNKKYLLRITESSKINDKNSNIDQKTRHQITNQIENKKKTTEDEGYTYKQMYVEKNLDLKYNAYAYDNLTTTKATKNTIMTLYPEYVTEATEYKSRKRHRKPATSINYGPHTFKQMYVEKNLDLKYDINLSSPVSNEMNPNESNTKKHKKNKKSHTSSPNRQTMYRVDEEINQTPKSDISLHRAFHIDAENVLTGEQLANYRLLQMTSEKNKLEPYINKQTKPQTYLQYHQQFATDATTSIADSACNNRQTLTENRASPDNTNMRVNEKENVRSKIESNDKNINVDGKNILDRIVLLENELIRVKTQVNHDNKVIEDLKSKLLPQNGVH